MTKAMPRFGEWYHRASAGSRPSHWPPDVAPLSAEGLDFFGADSKGEIYWDGKPLQVRRTLDLKPLQAVFASVVGIAAIIGGLGSGLNDGFEFACKQGWWTQHTCVGEDAQLDRQVTPTATPSEAGG